MYLKWKRKDATNGIQYVLMHDESCPMNDQERKVKWGEVREESLAMEHDARGMKRDSLEAWEMGM
jgi:hypothetical protein